MESCFPANTQKPVKLFFEDEARFGRINNLSKCWVNRKDRAIVNQQIIREYIYAYTTVCPATGETFSIISPQNDFDFQSSVRCPPEPIFQHSDPSHCVSNYRLVLSPILIGNRREVIFNRKLYQSYVKTD